MSSKLQGQIFPVFSLLVAATLWGVVWYPLRLLEHEGLSGLWTTAIVYIAATFVGLWLVRGRWHELRRNPWLLLLIAIANGWCNMAFILAVLDGHVVRVLLLFYLSPVWTTLLGIWLLNERLSLFSVITLMLAMLGALFMLWDPNLGFPWPQDNADWMAITAGMAFSVSNVCVRMAQGVSVRVKTSVTWAGVVVMAGVAIAVSGSPLPAVGGGVLLGAIMLGLLVFTTMTLAVQYGVSNMPVHRSAVILLFELVAGAVSSLLLTDEVIQPGEWVGGGFIVAAAYLSARSLMENADESHQRS